MLMSFPLAYHARIHTPVFNNNVTNGNDNVTNGNDNVTNGNANDDVYVDNKNENDNDWSHVDFCVEDWQFGFDGESHDPRRRVFYSVFSAFFQYLLPFTFISIIYGMIYVYLSRYRFVRDDNPADLEKVRRTNVMLTSIAIVYW